MSSSGDLTPGTRALLDAARTARTPAPADRARVRAALQGRLAAPQTQPPPATPPLAAPHARVYPLVRVGLAALVLGASVAGLWALRHHGAEASGARANASVATAPHAAASQRAVDPLPVGPMPTVALAPAQPAAATSPEPAVARRAARGARRIARTSRVASEAEPTADGERTTAPAPSPPAARAAGSPAAADAVVVRTPRDPIEDEMALVTGATRALNQGEPARALALLDQHAARFPGGGYVEEARATRVMALCRLGRRDDARAEAERFLRDAPRSPYASRVRDACADAQGR